MADDYDAFEEARPVVERLLQLSQEASDLDPVRDAERVQSMVEEATGLYSADVELVTRDGILRGPERLISDWKIQTRDFRWRFDSVRFLDAGDGTVVAFHKFVRNAREGDDYLVSWSATVFRVRDGKIVFFEGYPDANKATRDLGLDPSLAREA